MNVIGSVADVVIVSLLLIHMKLVKQRFVCVCVLRPIPLSTTEIFTATTHTFPHAVHSLCLQEQKKLPYATLNLLRDKHLPAAIGMAWFGRRENRLNHYIY